MHARALCGALTALVLSAGGCAAEPDDGAAAVSGSAPSPGISGTPQRTVRPPAQEMDRLEEAIRRRLAHSLAEAGVGVQHLDCPADRGSAVEQMHCLGWFDGVTGEVEVLLTREGGATEFDASMGSGLVATQNLVNRLHDDGYRDVDCGDRSVYRAEVGTRLVCTALTADGERTHLVATVTHESGTVRISD